MTINFLPIANMLMLGMATSFVWGMEWPTLQDLKVGAYRGGALIVAPENSRVNHLLPGMVLPVRLSQLEGFAPGSYQRQGAKYSNIQHVKSLDDIDIPDPDFNANALAYRDRQSSVRYGAIKTVSVDEKGIVLEVIFYEPTGVFGPSRIVKLETGQSGDLDGDGAPDVELMAASQPVVVDGAPVDYCRLVFINNRHKTTLFCLAPSTYSDGHYPSGIAGLTPSGKLLIQLDSIPDSRSFRSQPGTNSLTLCREEGVAPLSVSVNTGDYIINTSDGSVRRVESASHDRGTSSFVFKPSTGAIVLAEAYGALSLQLRGPVSQLIKRFGVRSDEPFVERAIGEDTTRWSNTWTLFNWNDSRSVFDNAYGKMTLQSKCLATVDLTTNLDVRWGSVRADWGVQLNMNQSERLDYQLTKSYTQSWSYPVASPQVVFAIAGVPVSISLPVTLGCNLAANGTATVSFGYQLTGTYGYKQWGEITWSLFRVKSQAGAPAITHKTTFEMLPNRSVTLNGTATVKPYLQLSPGISVAGVLQSNFQTQLFLLGTATGNGSVASSGHGTSTATLKLDTGITGDLTFTLGIWPIIKTWNIGRVLNYQKTQWQKTWTASN